MSRKEFLKLPVEERRKILEKQVAKYLQAGVRESLARFFVPFYFGSLDWDDPDIQNSKDHFFELADQVLEIVHPSLPEGLELRQKINQIMNEHTEVSDEFYGSDNVKVTQVYFDQESALEQIMSEVQTTCIAHEQQAVEDCLKLCDKLIQMIGYGDYSNGNESQGMDEGKVRARELMQTYEKQLESIKEKYLGQKQVTEDKK